MPSATLALCFGCDEKFMPLAKGLVLSLKQEADMAFAPVFIDAGVSEGSRAWLSGHGVTIASFDPRRVIAGYCGSGRIDYTAAQVCRPYLPVIAPGHSVYVWLDSDTWLQEAATLRSFVAAASTGAGKVAIAGTDGWVHGLSDAEVETFRGYSASWYSSLYGAAVGETYRGRSILNSGFFALSAASGLWQAWRREIELLFSNRQKMDRMDAAHAHMAEQTTLNYLCHARDGFIGFNAFHNFNCHLGAVERRNGQVRKVGDGANRIGLVHLTNFGRLSSSYLDRGLLFDEGRYLTGDERRALAGLAPVF